jgi:chromosome segregation ATPase
MAEEITEQQALNILDAIENENRARAKIREVLQLARQRSQELKDFEKTKAALIAENERLSKSKELYEKRREEYSTDFNKFVAEKEKQKDALKETIADLNKLADAKRKEIHALEEEYTAKQNTLFAETKEIERKHKEVKDSFEKWVSAHVK